MEKNSTASLLLPLSLPLQSLTPPFSLLYNCHLAAFHEQTHSKVVVLATVWRSSLPPLPLAADWAALSVTCRLTCQSAEQHRQAQGEGPAPLTQFPIQRRGRCLWWSPHKEGTQPGFLQVLSLHQIWLTVSKGRVENSFLFWEEHNVRLDDLKMNHQSKPNCPTGDFTTCVTSGNALKKNIQYSKLQQG